MRHRGSFLRDEIVVRGDHGLINAEVALAGRLRSGVVAMTHGWGNAKAHGMTTAQRFPSVNVNQLVPMGRGSYEKINNQARMAGINVNLEVLA